jgi:hypothetical protein
MRKGMVGLAALVFALVSPSAQEYEPTCKMCPGTYIATSEIDAYVKRAINNNLTISRFVRLT